MCSMRYFRFKASRPTSVWAEMYRGDPSKLEHNVFYREGNTGLICHNHLHYSTWKESNTWESELHLTRDDIPDVLVGMLSQAGFKVMQKCHLPASSDFLNIRKSGMRWWPHRLICEEISHCFSYTPVSNDIHVPCADITDLFYWSL